MQLNEIINTTRYAIDDKALQDRCRKTVDTDGVLVLPAFLTDAAIAQACAEGDAHADQAFYSTDRHNVFLKPQDASVPPDHPRNCLVTSSKGCITDDIVPTDSPLRTMYHSSLFQRFLCGVLGESGLYEYADPLSSINLHYASDGQELGWHFDNSSFAVTLLLQAPHKGGVFEYVNDLRDADNDRVNYQGIQSVLNGKTTPSALSVDPGALILFRGRNSMHRVTPVLGQRTRMLVVFAYNAEPGIALSESARMTFYGRLQ